MVALEEKEIEQTAAKNAKVIPPNRPRPSSSFFVLRSRCSELGSRVHQVSDWCSGIRRWP